MYLNDFNKKVLTKLFHESAVEFHELLKCHIYVYLWKGHPLASKEEITLEELEEYPCLSFDQGHNNSFYFAENALQKEEKDIRNCYSRIFDALCSGPFSY